MHTKAQLLPLPTYTLSEMLRLSETVIPRAADANVLVSLITGLNKEQRAVIWRIWDASGMIRIDGLLNLESEVKNSLVFDGEVEKVASKGENRKKSISKKTPKKTPAATSNKVEKKPVSPVNVKDWISPKVARKQVSETPSSPGKSVKDYLKSLPKSFSALKALRLELEEALYDARDDQNTKEYADMKKLIANIDVAVAALGTGSLSRGPSTSGPKSRTSGSWRKSLDNA
jgi:hypothetical protein